VTNSGGTVIAEQNFDAWGRKRNTSTWGYTGVQSVPSWLYRGFTGHEHLPQFGLINMNGRLYDPLVGSMLSPDNNVQMPDYTQNYNRYSYALNNPLRFTDPDGEVIWAAVLAGAIIGGILNVGIEGAKGNVNSFGTFLKSFGLGALQGALVGLGAPSVAAAVGNVAGATLSSLLPSVQIPLFNGGIVLSLSPAILFGSGSGIGLNLGITANTKYGSISGSLGLTGYWRHPATKTRFLEQRAGVGVVLGGEDFNIGYGSTYFGGGGIDQTVGFFRVGGKNWSLTYENDHMHPINFLNVSDGGDRFRTTGISAQVGKFNVNLNMFTGDPGLKYKDRAIDGADGDFLGTYRELGRQYRLGALTVGYGDYRLGWNSESIRNVFQNNWAHKKGYSFPLFEVLKIPAGIFTTYQKRNPFTTW
jgi:RHS repeat-associated protein